jgi:hypothetical protein
MPARIVFFPVDNGDMTLIELDDGRTVLIDVNIRAAADDEDDETPDVGALLRERLKTDDQERHYVDAFLLSHPDQDHCRGLRSHFHLGPASEYPKNSGKIFIREMWSSPLVFRRASSVHKLCDDAAAFNAEATRRVLQYKDRPWSVDSGDRILVLGDDRDGKTDDIPGIVVKTGQTFSQIDGVKASSFAAVLLAPLCVDSDEEEEVLTKNQSSTILRFSLNADDHYDVGRFLTGGDAEVAIWEKLWAKHQQNSDVLSYDILQTPHHCSWHSLSYDSWSDYGEDVEVAEDARKALGQARKGATLVASSKPISDDDFDPPCIRAKREYAEIADEAQGSFVCTMEYIETEKKKVLEFNIGSGGVKRSGGGGSFGPRSFSPTGGNPPKSEVRGGGRYGERAV